MTWSITLAGIRLGLLLALAGGVPAAGALDLQGHRGARGLAPENTLAAFATALGIGVTTLEMDLGITADGVVVVAHDSALNPDLVRDADGQWLASPGPSLTRLTLARLRRFDVGQIRPGSLYRARFTEQVAVDGATIPTLAEVIVLTGKAGNDQVRFNLETKLTPEAPDATLAPEAFAAAVIDVVGAAGIAPRTTIQSFDWRSLAAVQAHAPEIETVCLTAERRWLDNLERGRPGASPWLAGHDADDHASVPALVQAAGCRTWSPFAGDLDGDALAAAHDLGLQVIVWTVNDPAEMVALIDLGVDGIITDYPDRLRQLMAERGLPLPSATPVVP